MKLEIQFILGASKNGKRVVMFVKDFVMSSKTLEAGFIISGLLPGKVKLREAV